MQKISKSYLLGAFCGALVPVAMQMAILHILSGLKASWQGQLALCLILLAFWPWQTLAVSNLFTLITRRRENG